MSPIHFSDDAQFSWTPEITADFLLLLLPSNTKKNRHTVLSVLLSARIPFIIVIRLRRLSTSQLHASSNRQGSRYSVLGTWELDRTRLRYLLKDFLYIKSLLFSLLNEWRKNSRNNSASTVLFLYRKIFLYFLLFILFVNWDVHIFKAPTMVLFIIDYIVFDFFIRNFVIVSTFPFRLRFYFSTTCILSVVLVTNR